MKNIIKFILFFAISPLDFYKNNSLGQAQTLLKKNEPSFFGINMGGSKELLFL